MPKIACFVLILCLVGLAGCGAGGDDARTSAPTRVAAQFQALAGDPVKSGERLSRVLGCYGCHGQELHGYPWIEDPAVGVLHTANLTRALPVYSDAQIARALREGVRADGSPLWAMPSAIFSRLGDADMAALIAYLRTVPPGGEVHPRLVLGPEGRRMVAAGELKPEPQMVRESIDDGPPDIDGDHDRARYMIRATCAECHGLDLSGDPNPSPDSTAPSLSIVSAYSRPQFHHLLRTGEPVGGRTLDLMADVARGRFSRLTDAEVDAIYDYLAALAERPE